MPENLNFYDQNTLFLKIRIYIKSTSILKTLQMNY